MADGKPGTRKSALQFRRQLRGNLTPAETRLWKYLQDRQLSGRKFRRQHSFAAYVVDFYCPSEKLIVELDGAAHDSEPGWQNDAARTGYLTSLGLRIVRFENSDVMKIWRVFCSR